MLLLLTVTSSAAVSCCELGVNCLAEISNLHMCRNSDIETYAYVV